MTETTEPQATEPQTAEPQTTEPQTIEDIILNHDRRGISALRPHLPEDFCTQAARHALAHPGTVIIATGFYILASDAAETDGPPGAIAIGNALASLGNTVAYATDAPMTSIIGDWLDKQDSPRRMLHYAMTDNEVFNERHTADIVAAHNPALVIAIERCAPDAEGVYRNMRGEDISPQTGRIDGLFGLGIPSIGIGDGGNEIGMGNLADVIREAEQLPEQPAVTTCDHLIAASTSNWGGYGLVAAMSLEVGRNLLPDIATDTACIRYLVDCGAVSGVSGVRDFLVDEFTLAENAAVLQELHDYVNARLPDSPEDSPPDSPEE